MEINVMKCMLVKDSAISYSNQSDGSCLAEDPDMVNGIMQNLGVSGASDEYFYTLCLDTQCHIIGIHEISHGALTESIVHPREVFKRALLNNAYGIILVHNHPSGNTEPSDPDIETTRRLEEAGKILGIHVFDHIIVAPTGNYFSFKHDDMMMD